MILGKMDGTVVASGHWRELVLFGNGARSALAPNTCRIIEDLLPEAVDLCAAGAGEIIFSRLDPCTSITPHCAPTNLRLTAHLGLIVPPPTAGRCEIRVGNPKDEGKNGCTAFNFLFLIKRALAGWRLWHEGQVIIFDGAHTALHSH